MVQALIVIGGILVVLGLLYLAFWLVMMIAPVFFVVWFIGHQLGMSMSEVVIAALALAGLVVAGYAFLFAGGRPLERRAWVRRDRERTLEEWEDY
jgi:hypothetical protein